MEYTSLVYYVFMEARQNFAKTRRGASGGFLPRPLLLRLRHPNSEKRNQPKFCGILSPENCFRKTSSALFQISSSGLLSKKVRILYNEYRKLRSTATIICAVQNNDHREYILPPQTENSNLERLLFFILFLN